MERGGGGGPFATGGQQAECSRPKKYSSRWDKTNKFTLDVQQSSAHVRFYDSDSNELGDVTITTGLEGVVVASGEGTREIPMVSWARGERIQGWSCGPDRL